MRLAPTARAILIVVASAGSLALLPNLGVAESITVNLADTEIISMNLAGETALPLSTDTENSEPGSVEGYGLINTGVSITESASRVSTIQTTLVVTRVDAFNFNVAIDASINLFADLTLTDQDPDHGFAAGLGSPVTLLAPAIPLSVQLSDTFTLNVIDLLNDVSISDLFSPTTTSTTAVYPLGVDVNGNGFNDVLKFDASDLTFTLEEIALSDVEIDDTVIADFLNGGDLTINASLSLGVTGAVVELDGLVRDENTDPPFTITLTGPTTTDTLRAVPEPASVAFAAMGLAALFGVAWRYRRRA